MLLTIDKRGSKISRNSVFDCHLLPVWRQMAIKNSISNDFGSTTIDNINVFDCRLSGVLKEHVHLLDQIWHFYLPDKSSRHYV